MHCRRQPIFIADQMFVHLNQPSSIVLEIANICAIILITQDDNDTNSEISKNESEDLGESTLSSDIQDDDLANLREVLHLDQACRDETSRTGRVPLPKKRSRVDTVIARTALPNLRHPAGAMAPPLLICQKSAINISRESDIVQVLPLAKAGGDQNVPQQKPGSGDHNIPQHHKAMFEVAKRFIEAIVFTKTPWPIISDEKYSMVDEAWKLAIEAQDRQGALAGAPGGAPSLCQLPGGLSLKIDLQTREAVSVNSV
jgi:hypothetical protein